MWRLSASRFLSGKSVDYNASQTVMGEETSTFWMSMTYAKKKRAKYQKLCKLQSDVGMFIVTLCFDAGLRDKTMPPYPPAPPAADCRHSVAQRVGCHSRFTRARPRTPAALKGHASTQCCGDLRGR